MLREQAQILLAFWLRPLKAPSEALDRARLGVAIAFSLVVALLLQTPTTIRNQQIKNELMAYVEARGDRPLTDAEEQHLRERSNFYYNERFGPHPTPLAIAGVTSSTHAFRSLLLYAALAVPLSLALLALIEGRGRTGLCVQQNYAGLLCCLLFAWTAAYLPAALLQKFAPWFPILSFLYFVLLLIASLRTVMGSRLAPAAGSVAGGMALAGLFGSATAYLGGLVYLLASPCLLYYLWGHFGMGLSQIGGGLGRQQSFRRHLEALTLNDHDADAHYQLGLLYAQRKDWEQAETRFRRAAGIDPEDADYSLHLGRALRERGKLEESIQALHRAAERNDKAGANEVWRELGAAYLALRNPEPAATVLRKYVERLEYDPEGLVLLGQALRALGQNTGAAECFSNAIKAADTMPPHRRGEARHWAAKAKHELRS